MILTWLSKKLIRGCVTITFLALAASTFLLFTRTSGPVPLRIHRWEEFGCLDLIGSPSEISTKPMFACLSRCGRYYATAAIQLEKEGGSVQIHRWKDHSLLSRLKHFDSIPFALTVSSDERLIAIHACPEEAWPTHENESWLFNSFTGDRIQLSKDGMSRLEFSANGNQLCFINETQICYRSLANHDAAKTITLAPDDHPLWAFFDSADTARALVWKGDGPNFAIELIEVRSERAYWRLENVTDFVEPRYFSSSVFAARLMHTPYSITLYSIDTCEELRSYSCPILEFSDRTQPVHHSSKRDFLLIPTLRQGISTNPFFKNTPRWISNWLWDLERQFPALASSTCWKLANTNSDSPGVDLYAVKDGDLLAYRFQTAAFHTDAPVLTTIQDDGVYEWDLPPKTRLFTPWAWLSLAVTLVMGWFLWPRKSRVSGGPTSVPALQ